MRMNKSLTYIELGLQSDNVVAEHAFNDAPGCFTAWDIDPLSRMRGDIDELPKLGMFKCLNRLRRHK